MFDYAPDSIFKMMFLDLEVECFAFLNFSKETRSSEIFWRRRFGNCVRTNMIFNFVLLYKLWG